MEDPWASGSGWGETPKKETAIVLPISTSPIRSPPPPASDPWGAPTPETERKPDALPTFGWTADSVQPGASDTSAETPGWGGGWEERSEAGPSRSPNRRTADSPEWSISPREEDNEAARAEMPDIELPPSPSTPMARLSLEDPTSPGGFAESSSPQSPTPAIPDLGGFDAPATAQSPSFGDEFGGFSSFNEDPWDTKKKDEGWGGSSDHESSGTPEAVHSEEEQDERDGWGGSRSMDRREISAVTSSGMDQDWEEAQKRIKVTEQRAPREKIVHLQEGWRDLVKNVVGENQLADLPEDQEEGFSRALRKRDDDTNETLRSLSTIPPDTNTYPPVLSSMETIERYRYALARPNPTPETSLLNVSLSRRARQAENLTDSSDSWTTRSRLGEPEALPVESAPQSEDAKPKWSFWRKNTAEKPLVTSGGGILEAKSMSNTPVPVMVEPRISSTGIIPASTPAPSSRPASPAPAAIPTSVISPNPPAATSLEPVVPAQSAVGRFFGRLSRRQTSQPNDDDDDNKDFALSPDDFSFLDQVPSITSQGQDRNVGDLLAFEGGRTESMASLESMLNSKAIALPAPLAPPPAWARSSSSGPSYQKPKETDFLEGLDFDSDVGSSSLQPSQTPQARSSATAGSDWDQFLTSSTQTSAPTSAMPMIAPEAPNRSFTPPITPSALSPPPILQPQIMTSSPATGPSYRPPARQHTSASVAVNDFDDFADFAPAPATSAKADDFDDFGDFGDFSTPSPAVAQHHTFATPIQASTALKAPPSTGHIKRASLDHTLTLNLMSDASAVKGKRWPAPPSPLAPQLDPPPKAANPSSSFPFLTPPPPGARPSSGFGDLLDDDAKTTITSQPSPPDRMKSQPIAPSMAMAPTRIASPLARPPVNAPSANSAISKPALPGQSGLSAQDLSFFDSL